MSLLLLLLGGGAGGATTVDGTGTGALGTSGSATGSSSSTTTGSPVPFVEAAFGYGALTDPAVAVWTDISAYALSVSIRRGRNSEFDSFSPGTCTVTLDNSDRRFDPEYAAGPYYGNLIANVPIRVTATIEGASYPRFYGFVNEWPQSYSPPKWATTQVTATDGFKLLAGLRLPESVWADDIATFLTPETWLRLGESGISATDSSGNTHDGTYVQPSVTGPAPAVSEPHTSSSFIAEGTGLVKIPNQLGIIRNRASDNFWIGVLVIADPGVRESGTLVAQAIGGNIAVVGASSWEIHFASGVVVYNTDDVAGGFASFDAGIGDVGGVHWILVGGDSSGGQYIYFDGRELNNLVSTGSSPLSPDINTIWVGGEPQVWGYFHPSSQVAVMDVVLGQSVSSIDNPLLSPASVQNMWVDLLQPWVDDDTGTRIGRILDKAAWPAAQRAIDAGQALLGLAVLAGRAPLDYLQQVETTEQGRLFMDKSGKVTFHSRDHDLTDSRSTISQAVFSDDGDDIAYEPDFELTRDDRYVFREVTGSREGGSTLTVRDSTLTPTDMAQTKSLSNLMVRSDEEVRGILQSLLLRYQTPRTRPSAWSVLPLDTTSKWHTILGLEIGDRVTVQATPLSVGSQYADDFHLESIGEEWSGPTAGARFSFTGSPVDHTSYFTVGTSLLDGTDVLR